MSRMSSGTLPLDLSSFYFLNLMGHVVEIGYVRSFLVTIGTLHWTNLVDQFLTFVV